MSGKSKSKRVTATVAGKKDVFSSVPEWVPIAAILAVTALIYSQVVYNQFLHMDDDTFILNNPLLKAEGWDGIWNLFTNVNNGKYQPMVLFTYLEEYRMFGFDPFSFHLFNLVLHLLNTWLVYVFAQKLSGKTITAIVVAVLFALHPMHVEEVAWASELKDTLPAFFYLLTLIYYLRYSDTGFKTKYYVTTLLFFVLALLSKSAAVTLPLVLITIDFYKGRPMDDRAKREKIPLVLLSLFFFFLGALSKQSIVMDTSPVTYSFTSRIFFFTYVPSYYIVQLIAPFKLAAMHYYPQLANGALPWQYYASVPFILLVAWLVFRPSSFRKELVFGVLFFVITIALMEQIVSIRASITPERYTYIPYIGFFYIIGQWMSKLYEGKWRNVSLGAFAAILLLFCSLTWARAAVWKDDDSIFTDSIDKNESSPDSYYSYYILGNVKRESGDIKAALLDYNVAISLNPLYAGAYDNRGGIYFQASDLQSALLDFNKAIQLDPRQPNQYNNRALLKARMGDLNGAVLDYDQCLTLAPTDADAYARRGMVLLQLGKATQACADFRSALQYGNSDAAQLLNKYCH